MPCHIIPENKAPYHAIEQSAMPCHAVAYYFMLSHRALDGDVILSAAELDRPMNRGFVSGQCVSRTMSRQANAMQPSLYQ